MPACGALGDQEPRHVSRIGVQDCRVGVGEASEGCEHDLPGPQVPDTCRTASDKGEGAEEPVIGDAARMGADDVLARSPAEEDGVERAEEAG